jgi:hypothetical protein
MFSISDLLQRSSIEMRSSTGMSSKCGASVELFVSTWEAHFAVATAFGLVEVELFAPILVNKVAFAA